MSGWYGSLENRLMERAIMPTPVIGMGVTECCYTDTHAYEIIVGKIVFERVNYDYCKRSKKINK